MDWKLVLIAALPVISGLGAALIMGHYNLKAQKTIQINENARHARRLAYEAAMAEWRGVHERDMRDAARGIANIPPTPTPELFLLNHLSWCERVIDQGADSFGIEEYIAFLREREAVIAAMYDVREKFKKTGRA